MSANTEPPAQPPTLSRGRRLVGLVLGGVLLLVAAGCLVGYLTTAGFDGWVAYFLLIWTATVVLLLSGQRSRPPRWRAARLAVFCSCFFDVLVLSWWIWGVGFTGGDGDSLAALQLANWATALAAPFAVAAGAPRPEPRREA